MALLSLVGAVFLVRFLWTGLASGSVPGKLGAIHYAWSPSYIVSIGGCVLGIGFAVGLIVMGLREAGVVGQK